MPDADDRPVAAIDCGTNSTRLLIVGADGNVLARHMRITRLGEGVDSAHELAPEAIERTVAVLDEYKRMMDAHCVGRARLVATSATRDATNSDAFLSAASRVTGLCPELLSGEEEGRLSFLGATSALPAHIPLEEPLLVVDIGGGSTELVAGSSTPAGAEVVAASLDMGCVRISERFLIHDPLLPQELASARSFVTAALRDAARRLPELPPGGLVGLAGTVSTLVSLEKRLRHYERAQVHHAVLLREHVEKWLSVLAADTHAQRLARAGMVRGREDVIVGGVLVLAEVMVVFDRTFCLASEDDILDGLTASLRAA